MYIIKNAIVNLKRNIGRNVLTSIIIFMSILISAIAIIIYTTSNLIINDYKDRFGSEVYIHNTNDSDQKLDTKTLLSFGKSDYLQSTQFLAKVGYVPKNIKALDDDGNPASLKGYLLGSNREDINDDFQKGTYSLIEGNVYQNPKECIISKELAKLNQLQVGDFLSLQSNDGGKYPSIDLKITGIYEDVSLHGGLPSYNIALTNKNNEIFTSFTTVIETAIFQNYGMLDLKVYLKNPNLLQAFHQELQTKGLPNSYKVTTDKAGYQKIIEPVEHLADISKSMIIGVCALGSLLLILISIMVTKERMYEIGVLRAIGMKKKEVILGLLSETIVITVICLVLGIGCAQFSAKPIAKHLLSSQLSYETKVEEERLSNFNPSLNQDTVLEISLLSIGLALITSASSVLFTVRYEPIKILNKK